MVVWCSTGVVLEGAFVVVFCGGVVVVLFLWCMVFLFWCGGVLVVVFVVV